MISPPVTSGISTDRYGGAVGDFFLVPISRRYLPPGARPQQVEKGARQRVYVGLPANRPGVGPGAIWGHRRTSRTEGRDGEASMPLAPLARPWCVVCACCRLGRRCGQRWRSMAQHHRGALVSPRGIPDAVACSDAGEDYARSRSFVLPLRAVGFLAAPLPLPVRRALVPSDIPYPIARGPWVGPRDFPP